MVDADTFEAEEDAACAPFAALGNPLRLRIFRLVVAAGPAGLRAGAIADRLEVPPSTLSTHLRTLQASGLLTARRERQRILYGVDARAVRSLVAYLVEDCCGGRPELCGLPRCED